MLNSFPAQAALISIFSNIRNYYKIFASNYSFQFVEQRQVPFYEWIYALGQNYLPAIMTFHLYRFSEWKHQCPRFVI